MNVDSPVTQGGGWLSQLRWNRRVRGRVVSFSAHFSMILLSLIFLIPMFWMLSTSLKSRAQTWLFPPEWIPNPVVWEHFPRILEVAPVLLFFQNTMIIVFWNVLGQVFSTSLVAFGFARLRFPGRDVLFILLIATLMIPYQVTLIPTFILFKLFGWINTFLPLTVPAFTGSAFFIFLMRQYLMSLPFDLDDAARMDGCNTFQVLFFILLPLCIPPLVIVVVFTFIGVWNDFLGPLIYLNENTKYTIALGLNLLRGRNRTDYNVLMAASLLAVLPTLIVYFLAQNKLIGGIASVGLKG
ncbi:MAG: carbohydrate ABC transporter permease [Caldilineaceae bacterium]|nr:carbohydrate ABC transporter permease [Caldilineaceae bacterium]